MQKLFTVSIGISAYNEQANIKNLLVSLLSQKTDNFELKEIIVLSDGSTDNTVLKAQSVGDPRVILGNDGIRKGAAVRQNEILNMFKGEILVLLDADVLPKNEMFLHYLTEPFYLNPRLGIVSNDGTPLPAKHFFEKIINFSVAMRHEMTTAWNRGNNIYLCHGHNRAFSREFGKQFRFGPSVSEDAYAYLKCKEMGFEFFYQPKAEIWYRSPQNLNDHLKQSVRFFQGNKMLKNYFPGVLVKRSFTLPFGIVFGKTCKYFFKDPFKFLSYLFIVALSSLKSKFTKLDQNIIWESSQSSKSL